MLGVLIEREPEALLSLGDPSALELRARGRLLRAFVAAYGEGGWRGLDFPDRGGAKNRAPRAR